VVPQSKTHEGYFPSSRLVGGPFWAKQQYPEFFNGLPTVSFTTSSSLLAENTVAVRSTSDISEQSSRWWCLLKQARSFFDQNPSA
jgi:hypothetical protein